jgi:hypothetical protein
MQQETTLCFGNVLVARCSYGILWFQHGSPSLPPLELRGIIAASPVVPL